MFRRGIARVLTGVVTSAPRGSASRAAPRVVCAAAAVSARRRSLHVSTRARAAATDSDSSSSREGKPLDGPQPEPDTGSSGGGNGGGGRRRMLLGLAGLGLAAVIVSSRVSSDTTGAEKQRKEKQAAAASAGAAAAAVASKSAPATASGAASAGHSSTGGYVFAWGSNMFGQCATGGEALGQPVPYYVHTLHEPVTAIGAGADASFAVTESGGGHVYAWGRNRQNALGQGGSSAAGSAADTSVPLPNLSLPRTIAALNGMRVQSVDANEFHAAAVDDAGRLWVWGNRIGLDGAALSSSSAPVLISAPDLPPLQAVSCGRSHTLLLARNGDVYAFGSGRDGALGTGARDDVTIAPVRIAALPGPVSHIAAGNGFSLFVSADSGQLLSCGIGDFGQTALSRDANAAASRYVLTPTAVSALSGKRLVSISAGATHAAGVGDDHTVWTWGYGKDGQIGDGNREVFNPTPVEVTALSGQPVTAVRCGGAHTAALTRDGALYVWGRGRHGQLGTAADPLGPAAAYRPLPYRVHFFDEPVAVGGGSGGKQLLAVRDVALGNDHTLALAVPRPATTAPA